MELAHNLHTQQEQQQQHSRGSQQRNATATATHQPGMDAAPLLTPALLPSLLLSLQVFNSGHIDVPMAMGHSLIPVLRFHLTLGNKLGKMYHFLIQSKLFYLFSLKSNWHMSPGLYCVSVIQLVQLYTSLSYWFIYYISQYLLFSYIGTMYVQLY